MITDYDAKIGQVVCLVLPYTILFGVIVERLSAETKEGRVTKYKVANLGQDGTEFSTVTADRLEEFGYQANDLIKETPIQDALIELIRSELGEEFLSVNFYLSHSVNPPPAPARVVTPIADPFEVPSLSETLTKAAELGIVHPKAA